MSPLRFGGRGSVWHAARRSRLLATALLAGTAAVTLAAERTPAAAQGTVGTVVDVAASAALTPTSVGGPPVAPEQPRTLDGPWGRLELQPLRIRLPREMVPAGPLPLRPWHFGRTTPESARAKLVQAGLPAELADAMLATLERDGSDLRLHPDARQLAALEPEARARLYAQLRRRPDNADQRAPQRFQVEHLAGRFAALRPETRALVERLLYAREDAPGRLFLSDLPAATALVTDADERAELVQAVSSREGLMPRLRLDATSDVEALLRYWDVGHRRRDLEPLLRSVAAIPGGYSLDVVQLLPRFARMQVFTYPPPEQSAGRDCFWTAVNFLEEVPGPPGDTAAIQRRLVEEYSPVPRLARLGDLLTLESTSGELLHAAVYVAGDVVFTRNGDHFSVPWLLMALDDMLEVYADLDPAGIHYWRRRTR
jgi:hypothetical protein